MSDPREDRNLGEGAGENGPGEPREVRHQPASLSDLRRFPPRTPECLRVREWMRDACDGELAAATRSEFEEHLHRCRDCSNRRSADRRTNRVSRQIRAHLRGPALVGDDT